MIYGIDSCSKTIAVTWWNGILYDTRFFDIWDRWAVDSAPWVSRIMRRFFSGTNLCQDDFVFLEAPVVAGARNIQATVKQAFINGIIQSEVGRAGAMCVLVAPSTWKVSSTGRGGASKDQVADAIRRHDETLANTIGSNQDQFDATGLCIHGRCVVEGLAVASKL